MHPVQKSMWVWLCQRAMVSYAPFVQKMGDPTLLLPDGWLASHVLKMPQATLGRDGMLGLK